MTAAHLAPRTALVVDDEAGIRTLVRRILEKEHWTVLEATNGREALEILNEKDGIDVMIADVNMPAMNGLDLAAAARSRQPLPILFLTGYVDRLFMGRRLLQDGEAYLGKPFSRRGLLEAIRLLLAASGSGTRASAPPFEFPQWFKGRS